MDDKASQIDAKNHLTVIALILLSRFIYSLNWFAISPALPAIAASGEIQKWMIGIIPLLFFAFTGSFQIPSGFVSNKLGAPSTYSIGLVLLSLGNMMLVFNQSFGWIFLTRAVSGLGAALFFASAGSVLLGLSPGRPGFMMGLYNVAFALGGGAGLLWGILHEYFGWKVGMLSAGGLGVITAFVCYLGTRNLKEIGKFSISDALEQLRNKDVLNLSLAFTGTWGTYLAAGLLLPTYLELGLQHSVALSGTESAPLLFASIFGGFSAALYDRIERKRLLLFLTGLLSVLPAAFFGFFNGRLIIPSLLILGFFNEMAITICYAHVNHAATGKNAASFAVINTIQILLGMLLLPVVTIVAQYSWFYAWVTMSVIAASPLALIINLKEG